MKNSTMNSLKLFLNKLLIQYSIFQFYYFLKFILDDNMAILKPEELKEKFDDPWIAPYEKVITMADGDLVELIEYHPCPSGSNWLLYQYQHSSELIIDAKRDGNKHTYLCKVGKKPIDLKASINAAGIEEVAIDEEAKEVKVTHGGLAGAGVGAGAGAGVGAGAGAGLCAAIIFFAFARDCEPNTRSTFNLYCFWNFLIAATVFLPHDPSTFSFALMHQFKNFCTLFTFVPLLPFFTVLVGNLPV